jgi:hypothetical protein
MAFFAFWVPLQWYAPVPLLAAAHEWHLDHLSTEVWKKGMPP